MFDPSMSDEGASGADVSQLFLPAFHSSPATSPTPASFNGDEGFVLDTSFFDIIPSTPDLAVGETAQSSQDRAADRGDTQSLRRFASKHQDNISLLKPSDTHKQSPSRNPEQQMTAEQDTEPYEDPLAEFEAWLKSGAVEIVEE